ncbi:rhodanese-like domain-containing protein [Halopenitus sp. H-Gu1]|uniref:rhodanese-like domain-containing protein n=1 Tax=Halopenitus sp. H-Gu1 TaxID=3242697 RepID=UPI00359E25AD
MVEEVTPEEVEEELEDDDVQIVDIRNPPQYADGHIPGAINIPMAELPRRVGEYDWNEEIVVVCPIGQSSIQAAKLIKSFEGVDDDARIASMEGGYRAWDGDLETEE